MCVCVCGCVGDFTSSNGNPNSIGARSRKKVVILFHCSCRFQGVEKETTKQTAPSPSTAPVAIVQNKQIGSGVGQLVSVNDRYKGNPAAFWW